MRAPCFVGAALFGLACAGSGTGGAAAPTPVNTADLAIAPDAAAESLLVDVRSADSTIQVEMRYGTPDNFTGAPLPGYDANVALMRHEAARALGRVQQRLRPRQLGLRVYDAYRPRRATTAMVEWAERTGQTKLLDDGYIARRSRHNMGVAIDLTLVHLPTGRPLEMGTPYDTFSEAAHTANATGDIASNRQVLVDAMEAEGFENYDQEWWHFSYQVDGAVPFDLPVTNRGEAQSTSRDTTVRSWDGRSMPAELVGLPVPERRSRPGRTITVAALRFASTAERPGRPIVFLMGGPGIPGTVMVPIPPYFTLFERLREIADVVIVDQRGIGRSEPALDCPARDTLPADLFLRRERIVEILAGRIASCADSFRSQGVDPTAYNTVESADDIDDLRRALGADRIDLLAFSYGSRLALMYAQRHAAHVGSIVLQGVNGPGLVLKRPGPIARKLDRTSAILARDSAWHGPTDLRAAARAALDRLDRQPAMVAVTDRRTGRQVELMVGREGFDALISLGLDDARLPALLVSVAAGDDRVLARFAEGAWNGLAAAAVGLMPRAVNCAADRPGSRWDLLRTESAAAPFGAPIDNEFLTADFCRSIGYAEPAVEFAGPVTGDAPLLLLTGSLDATNPVENAAEVARGFAKAVSLEVEGAAHEALPIPAVQEVIVDFFRGTDVRGRRLAALTPSFASIDEAAAPPRQR